MKVITFRLRLLEPVLVSQAQSGEENSAIGLPFIPGGALRGALVARYLQKYPIADPAGDTSFQRLFLDGTVRYLNAYPWREDSRLLPTPMSWFTEKDRVSDTDALIFDWAVDPAQRLEQPKSPDGDFCVALGDSVGLHRSPRQVNVHITLENPNYRGDENKVYRYDALAAGEVMAAAIVAPDDVDLTKAKELLQPDEIAFGGAHLAGYGRSRIEAVATDDLAWEEYPPGHNTDSSAIIVTLLSDAIVRDRSGQVSGDLSAALAAALGLASQELKPLRAYQSLRPVAGFNRKWSLPLTQTWAVQAGSVFVYPADAVDPDALTQAVAHGIGERRAEGFGRVAVNWQTEPQLRRYELEAGLITVPRLSEASKELARQMADRRLRLLLDRKLAEAVNRTRLSRLPQNAQLSRVRIAAQQALKAGKLKPISDHLKHLKGAREQFTQARVGEATSMFRWIEERVGKQDIETQLLRGESLPEVAGEKANLTDGLKVEYTARLVDGVMKKAVKQNQGVIK